SKTVKLTKHLTCTFMNSNTKTKSSTLSVSERTVSDSIWLKFQRQPRGHAKRQFQRSQESGVRSQESGVKSQESRVRRQESGPTRRKSGTRRQPTAHST